MESKFVFYFKKTGSLKKRIIYFHYKYNKYNFFHISNKSLNKLDKKKQFSNNFLISTTLVNFYIEALMSQYMQGTTNLAIII